MIRRKSGPLPRDPGTAARRRGWIEDFQNDLGFAGRQLQKSPGFAAVAIFSLALGIGANTAIFTIIQSTLLRPIPLKHLDRLRLITWREQWGGWVAPNVGFLSPTFGSIYEQRLSNDGGLMHAEFSPPVYREFLRANTSFETLVGFKELGRVTAVVDGGAEPLDCFLVSDEFYRGFDITPVIGRAIGNTPEDSVLISYQYWTRRFGRSPSVIGKHITLNAVPMTIIGVNPEYFTGIEPGASFEVWAPLRLPKGISDHAFLDEPKPWSIPIIGKLKPGVSDAQAQSEMDAIFQAKLDVEYPGRKGAPPKLLIQPASRGVDYLTARYDKTLLAAFGLAGLVLLIACMNVANLLLARSAVRRREISMKLALGATRGRIVRQLLTEGLLLASLAGAVGVILGIAARNSIPRLLMPSWRPSFFDPAFDPGVLLVSLGITLLTGVLFSLAPVWQSRRVEVNDALKDGSRATASLSKLRAGRALVVLQIGLSLLLLVGASICVRTFTNLRNAPVGLQPKGVLLFALDLPSLRYPADRVSALFTSLQERLNATPGIESATFFGTAGGGASVEEAGGKPLPASANHYSYGTDLGSRFFDTMGIPILHGRSLNERDSAKGSRVVVVNQEFARRFFHREDIAGETVTAQVYTGVASLETGRERVALQIVGVCANWRMDRFRDDPLPAVYGASIQAPRAGQATFAVRIAGDEASAVRQIREALRSVDAGLAITDVHTLAEHIENGLSQERLLASLGGFFGGLSLILASIGIYGVMAYATARRTNEIGVRMALGARPDRIARMILREALLLAGTAMILAAPVAVIFEPVLDHALAPGWRDSFVYGVKPNDASPVVWAAFTLGIIGLLAGYLPARRAARTDPMTVLRHD